MDASGLGSVSSSDGCPPSSKKRKTLLSHESELDLMKRERENDKELIEEQKETIYEQTMKIRNLKKQLKESFNISVVDPEIEERLTEMKARETELRLENDKLRKQIEDEKSDHEKSLSEMKLTLSDQIGKLENDIIKKDAKIKNLEEYFPAILEIKPDPDDAKKLLQDKIDQLQSSHLEFAKKIEDLEAELLTKSNLENSHQSKLSAIEENLRQQQKLLSEKLEKKVEEGNKTIKELNGNMSTLEKSHNNVLNKNMLDKNNEIHKLIDKHEQEMKALNAKFDDEGRKAKSELDGLKLNVDNFKKKLIVERESSTKLQSELKLNINVAKKVEKKLICEIDELKQKLRKASFPRFFTLNEVRSKILCDRIMCKSIAVIKVEKLVCFSNEWKLYSTLDANEEPVELDLYSPKSCYQFQINGELKIKSSYVFHLIPRLYSFTFTKLDLGDSRIKHDDFKILVSSHTVKTFIGGNIEKQNEYKILGIDEIMKELRNIENCDIQYYGGSDDIQKFVELPVFKNLKNFTVSSSTSSFDFNSFGELINKYPNVEFFFKFSLCALKAKSIVRENEKEFRKLLPSTCKVVIQC